MPNSQCTTCEKVFEKLDTDTAYSVSVRGYNRNGLGPYSIQMFKPDDKFVARDYSLDSAVDKFTENYEMCDYFFIYIILKDEQQLFNYSFTFSYFNSC